MQDRTKAKVKTTAIPYLHPKVDVSDIGPNGKLLSDEQIEAIKAEGILVAGRNGKKELFENHPELGKLPFGIEKVANKKGGFNYYAVYKGKKKGKSLGEGFFGAVKLVQDLDSGQWEVIKIATIKKPSRRGWVPPAQEQKKALDQEIIGLEKAGQLLGQLHERKKIMDRVQYEMIMTLAPGTQIADMNQPMPFVRWLDMVVAIMESVRIAHEKNLIHRDIKPENLHYYAANKQVSLVDWGLAAVMDKNRIFKLPSTDYSSKGTPGFMSPEIISMGLYSEKSDVYATGKTIADILKLTTMDAETKISIEKHINLMTDTAPEKRPTLQESMRFFTALRQNYLATLALPTRATYLDVHDYLAAQGPQKEDLLNTINNADEVWLIDEQEKNQDAYSTVKTELEGKGLIVRNEVVQYDHEQRAETLLRYCEQREEEDKNIYECFHVMTEDNQASLHRIGSPSLSDKQTNKLVASLENEISPTWMKATAFTVSDKHRENTLATLRYAARSLGSHSSSKKSKTAVEDSKNTVEGRKMAVEATIEKILLLHENKNLTYDAMHKELIALQKQLQPKNTLRGLLQTGGLFKKTSKIIAGAVKELEKEMPNSPRRKK